MNTLHAALCFLLLFSQLVTPAPLTATTGRSITIESELLDLHCFLQGKRSSNHRKGCGEFCALHHYPIGVESKGGDVYTLIAAADLLAKYVGSTVRITGSLTHSLLVPEKIEVWENGKWNEIETFQADWSELGRTSQSRGG